MTKLNIKKISAVACAAAIAASLTGCGEKTTWGAEIDGKQIPAGVFIYYLQTAYYDAQTKQSELNADIPANADGTPAETAPLFSIDIEEKAAKEWIYDEATKSMQRYAAIEAKFDEYGLALSDSDLSAAQAYCDELWDYGGEYYSQMGISQDSYISVYLNSQKENMVFEHLYSEGGEYGVPDSDIRTHLSDNYAMINFIELELKDGAGNLLKSDGEAEVQAMAEDYIERYNNGESFDALNAEYTAYYADLQAEAEAQAAEQAALEAEASALEQAETAQVEAETAQAPLDGEGDVLMTDEKAAEAAEAAVTETTAVTTTAAPAETTAPVEEAVSETTVSEAEIEIPADTVTETQSNQTVIEKDSATPDPEVAAAAFEMASNETRIVKSADGESLYLVLKMDILETDEYYLSAKQSLLYEMKSEDYDALIEQWTAAQSIARNQDAYKRYDPEKMLFATGA